MARYENQLKRSYNDTVTWLKNISDSDDELESAQPPPAKKHSGSYSSKSLQMMQRMGYKNDCGLGKRNQGRLEPIEIFQQKGRRGFGNKPPTIQLAAQWNPEEEEEVTLREVVETVSDSSDDLEIKTVEQFKSWMKTGVLKMTISGETQFCKPQLLEDILSFKSAFDGMNPRDVSDAHARSNPFEASGKAIFQNRAAMKMANMDAIFDFMFTNPVDEDGNSLLARNEQLCFADVCAGPGGFSEYVLWRKGWQSKGFGFTLKAENDFKLDRFLAGDPSTFSAHYGAKGDGNVFDPENIVSFSEHVINQTGSGVHFMMADGGFSVEGHENIQEILSKQIYLCQCLMALSIVRTNGNFVTKLFDVFTPFSVGLIYLMYKCFKQICIVKPNTSRPANSERYLICKWKKPNTDTIRKYLFDVNVLLFNKTDPKFDIVELVPYGVIRGDKTFFNFIYESNMRIGRNVLRALRKMVHYAKDKTLRDQRQEHIKCKALHIWNVPDEPRARKPQLSCEQNFYSLLGPWTSQREFMAAKEQYLSDKRKLDKTFFDVSDWAFMSVDVVENSGKCIRNYFMSTAKGDIYKYSEHKTWVPMTEIYVEMPPKTLLYGEIVQEFMGEGAAIRTTYALHIIDAIVLGGVDVRNWRLEDRHQMCEKFASAADKPIRTINQNLTSSAIRCKPLFALDKMRHFFDSMEPYQCKNGRVRLGLSVQGSTNENRFHVPRGVLFFKLMKPNLCKRFDRKLNDFIYHDLQRKKDFRLRDLKDPQVIYGSHKSSFAYRLLWKWEVPQQVERKENKRISEMLYRSDLEKYIRVKCNVNKN